jgi:hypothetical protein
MGNKDNMGSMGSTDRVDMGKKDKTADGNTGSMAAAAVSVQTAANLHPSAKILVLLRSDPFLNLLKSM